MSNSLKNRALALFQDGAYIKSDKLYREILNKTPGDSGAWHMRGYIAVQLGKFDRAVEYIEHAIELKPNVYSMHVNLGAALAILGRYDEAIEAQRKAIELKPTGAEAQFGLANSLRADGQFENADAAYEEALALSPNWPDALEATAINAMEIGDREKMQKCAFRALELEPTRLQSNKLVGDMYVSKREYDKAFLHYSKALEADPDDAATNANLGLLLMRTGNCEASVTAYKKAVAKDPTAPVARHGLSLALLALGRLSEGWLHYEARLERPGHLLGARPMASPRLHDAPKDKKALAWADEGVGEQIMFASLIPEIEKDTTQLSLECDARLAPLFQRSFPDVEVIPRCNPPDPRFNAPYDGQFNLGNAGRWYRPSFESFPRQRGYLAADMKLCRELRRSYTQKIHRSPLVGISWRTRDEIKFSPEKSIGLTNWGPLLSVPGATFVNLQYGDHREEIADAETTTGTMIISDPRVDPLKNLESFASQVAAMDLVITISNATAHMAGALNVATWAFIPKGFGAMWHWFQDRDDSPWYPSVKLLRQERQGDWNSVIDRASSMLIEFVAQWRRDNAK